MKILNGSQAIIHPDKLRSYLLDVEHSRGGSKAILLHSFGYTSENWQVLENDLRQYHLQAEIIAMRETAYGTRYEIRNSLITPNGRSL